jgi:hypothetical protein
MTKRRKLVPPPAPRVKTEVKEEKPIIGKYLFTYVFLNSTVLSFMACLFSNLASIVRFINISYDVRLLASHPAPSLDEQGLPFVSSMLLPVQYG